MSFTHAEVLYLTSGDAAAYVQGAVTWHATNRTWRGEAAVLAAGFPDGSIRFVLNIAVPNEPSFVLIIKGRHCWRLDVNVPHKALPGTHLQENDATGRELQALDAQHMFPPIPEEGSVGGEQYAATFKAFAEYLNISTAAMDWVDPPEGRPE